MVRSVASLVAAPGLLFDFDVLGAYTALVNALVELVHHDFRTREELSTEWRLWSWRASSRGGVVLMLLVSAYSGEC